MCLNASFELNVVFCHHVSLLSLFVNVYTELFYSPSNSTHLTPPTPIGKHVFGFFLAFSPVNWKCSRGFSQLFSMQRFRLFTSKSLYGHDTFKLFKCVCVTYTNRTTKDGPEMERQQQRQMNKQID